MRSEPNHRKMPLIAVFLLPAAAAVAVFSVVPLAVAQTASSTVDAVAARRAQLQSQLDELQKEIDAQNAILADQERQSVSLERDIAIIDANIQKAQLSIKARNITIQQLQDDIAAKEQTIGGLSDKLTREEESLGQIIRQTNQIDSYTLTEVILSGVDVSQFFQDLDSYDAIKASLNSSYQTVVADRTETQAQKSALEDQQSEENALLEQQKLQQQRLQEQEAQKQEILKESKGQEAVYQQIIASKQKDAATIRAELFTLQGSAAIPFEKAYEYALEASQKTGVQPSLILGIIAEESDLGENVGTGNWQVDMANPRDTVPFIQICQELGLDPNKMPVSKKPWYGWGGAMGPAQFIPSTWILYEDRIAKLTGDNPPNPWNPRDAFMAAAILLADNGATDHSAAAERLAALRYLAGWKYASNPAYSFYGDDVMNLANKYQQQIAIIAGN